MSDFRSLPSVDKILSSEQIKLLEGKYPHDLLVNIIRQHLDIARQMIASGKPVPAIDQIVNNVLNQIRCLESPSLRPVINATGVVLHTNLGRAPISKEAIAAMEQVSKGYSNTEFDIESGVRGSRQTHIEWLLTQLTGAEAAIVVNNNAAAVLLGLSALAKREEIIISRGQAVEIGDSFRIPDVMRQSGAKLIEVGTTNCTYIRDFEQAITNSTAVLMQVHTSNFKVIGFTEGVTTEELSKLGKKHNISVLDDQGSGCFLDTTAFGLASEPMVQASLANGASLVFFSGDKLVGGPQAGIVVGKKELIEKLKRHPLARAVRIDKTRLAGLIVTFTHYLKGEALQKIPVWRMISMPLPDIERRAKTWVGAMGDLAEVRVGESMVGGGSLPGSTLPTILVAVGKSTRKKDLSMAQLAAQKLRDAETPIIGRISENVLLLDPRTVFPEEDASVIKALNNLAVFLQKK